MEPAPRSADLRGVGAAMPGPLFLVDAAGRAHPLNGLARQLPANPATSEAFSAPVRSASGSAGHVVGYLAPGAPADRDAALVAALVALAAQVVSRSLGGDPGEPEPEAPGDPAPGLEALEEARRRLGSATSEQAVADILVEGTHAAFAARLVALLVPSGQGLDCIARRGVEACALATARAGGSVLGAASARMRPTACRSVAGLGTLAAEAAGSGATPLAIEPWLEPPFVVVPIRVGAELLGLLCVTGLPRMPGVDVAQRAARALERLADRAAACIAGARMIEQLRAQERMGRELEIARQIQRSLLPHRSLSFQGLELAGECRPAAQVGGDHFGFRAQGGRLTATLFDVAGHGVGAAFCMTLVRSALNGEIARGGAPAEVLARANDLAFEDLSESSLYATAFLARFDRDRGVLEYASAGHARPVMWSAGARSFVDLPEGGMPLGMFAEGPFPGGEIEFAPGDLLVLYTDGIVDAENPTGEKFARQRLLSVVRRARRRNAQEVLRRTWRELAAFVADRPLRDDATLVVVRGGEAFGSVERPGGRRNAQRALRLVEAAARGPSDQGSS